MSRQIFVNLPVRDLDRAKAFFSQLGFSFNPRFSDATAACMVVADNILVMLLTHEKFSGFTPGPICDARASTEVLVCLSCDSRDEVDDFVRKALAAGGSTFREPEDHGFMYGHAFQDPDGHVWELAYVDMDAMPQPQ